MTTFEIKHSQRSHHKYHEIFLAITNQLQDMRLFMLTNTLSNAPI